MIRIRESLNKSIASQKLKYIEEKVNGKQKHYYIEGIFAVADEPNGNNRVYSKKVLTEAVNEYVETRINRKRAIGELNHPTDEDLYTQITQSNVVHNIEKLWWEGNLLMGRSKIMDDFELFPSSRSVVGLIKEQYPWGVSLRGFGDTTEDHIHENVNSLFILCWDLVDEPGFNKAFVDSIYENKEYIISGDKVVEQAVNKFIKNTSDIDNLSESDKQSSININCKTLLAEFRTIDANIRKSLNG